MYIEVDSFGNEVNFGEKTGKKWTLKKKKPISKKNWKPILHKFFFRKWHKLWKKEE